MDLSELDLTAKADAGAEMRLHHPVSDEPLSSDDGKPITIRVLGQDSREFRAAAAELAERMQGRKRLSVAAAEAQSVELLARCVKAWSGIVWEGKPLPCTPENVRMVLRERKWVRDQVDAFVTDRAAFFR